MKTSSLLPIFKENVEQQSQLFSKRLMSTAQSLGSLKNPSPKPVTGTWSCMGQLTEENEAMKKQLDYLSNFTQRENICIIGLPESAEMPDPTNFISRLLLQDFGPIAFEIPIIIGRIEPRPMAGDRPRPKFISWIQLLCSTSSAYVTTNLFKGLDISRSQEGPIKVALCFRCF